MRDLSGKRVLITGASSGIGRALAVEFAGRGSRLFLVARREERLRTLTEQLSAKHHEACYAVCDVSDAADVALAARTARESLGGIDVVVLNAGIGGPATMANGKGTDVERVFQVNFLSKLYWLDHVLPWFLEQGEGAIVGISSLAAARGLPGSIGYSASKAAFSTFLESLRLELRPRAIQVLTVEPGFVKTEMTEGQGWLPFALEADDAARRIVRALQQGRSVLRFPAPTAMAMGAIKVLPPWLYDATVGRF